MTYQKKSQTEINPRGKHQNQMTPLVQWRKVEGMHNLSKSEKAQKLHQAAWDLLKEMCTNHYGINLEQVQIGRNAYQKPYLVDLPNIHFNLTHSEQMVACIIAEKEVGIDIEKIRMTFHQGVMKKICTLKEQKLIEEAQEAHVQFFKLWTLKESYIKAVGEGLHLSMKRIEFNWENGQIISNQPEYEFTQHSIGEEYILSICRKK